MNVHVNAHRMNNASKEEKSYYAQWMRDKSTYCTRGKNRLSLTHISTEYTKGNVRAYIMMYFERKEKNTHMMDETNKHERDGYINHSV